MDKSSKYIDINDIQDSVCVKVLNDLKNNHGWKISYVTDIFSNGKPKTYGVTIEKDVTAIGLHKETVKQHLVSEFVFSNAEQLNAAFQNFAEANRKDERSVSWHIINNFKGGKVNNVAEGWDLLYQGEAIKEAVNAELDVVANEFTNMSKEQNFNNSTLGHSNNNKDDWDDKNL